MIKDLRKLKTHLGLQKYFFNTSWMLFEQGLRMLSGLFIGVWMARYLGPDQYGIFSYTLSFFLIFQSISKLGLDDFAIKGLVENPSRRSEVLGTTFWLKLISSFIFIGLMALLAYLAEDSASVRIFIIIVSVGLLFRSLEVTDFYFRSQVQAKMISMCRIVQLLINSAFKILLIVLEADLKWFILTILTEHIMLGMFYYFAYYKSQKESFFCKFNSDLAKGLINQSWPIMLSSSAVILTNRLDQILINFLIGSGAVGVYAASFRVVEVLYTLPTILANSLFPAIINAKNKNEASYVKRMKRLFCFTIWGSTILAIVVTCFNELIINLLYKSNYSEAANILTIQIWSLVFMSIATISSRWYLAEGLQKYELWRNIFGAIINITLNMILIPKMGISGAAWAGLGALISSSILFDLTTPKLRTLLKLKIMSLNPRNTI